MGRGPGNVGYVEHAGIALRLQETLHRVVVRLEIGVPEVVGSVGRRLQRERQHAMHACHQRACPQPKGVVRDPGKTASQGSLPFQH